MPRISVLIADDHALVRSAFRSMLGAQADLCVVGEAEDGVAVVEACRRLTPDIVLMDLTMPGRGGIPAIKEIRRLFPNTRVVVVTMHEDEAFARQAFLAGASGYVLKTALSDELLQAIRTVVGGGRHVTPSLAAAVADTSLMRRAARQASVANLLTPRELEVVSLVALGHTTLEIGRRLHISEKTVETHRNHIMEKLGCRTRADLVRFALEHNLIAPGKG